MTEKLPQTEKPSSRLEKITHALREIKKMPSGVKKLLPLVAFLAIWAQSVPGLAQENPLKKPEEKPASKLIFKGCILMR